MSKEIKERLVEVARREMAQIEKLKNEIAMRRDKLREYHSELDDLLSSLDVGIGDIANGLRTLESGLDTISEVL